MVTVGLSMIVKDRERTIGRALESVKPFMDELLVVDTGSSDRTVEIAKEHGARVEHFAWCDDFAAARNAALDFGCCDWIFALDSDEWIEPEDGKRLRELVENGLPAGFHAYRVAQHHFRADGTTLRDTFFEKRLFPRTGGLRWEGVVSEIPLYMPNPAATAWVLSYPPVVIWHVGNDNVSTESVTQKNERNVRCLQRALARNPWDPGALLRMAFYTLINATILGSAEKRRMANLSVPILFSGKPGLHQRWRDVIWYFRRFIESLHRAADSNGTTGFYRRYLPIVHVIWIQVAAVLGAGSEVADARDSVERCSAQSRLWYCCLAIWELSKTPKPWQGEPDSLRRTRLAIETPACLHAAIRYFEVALGLPDEPVSPEFAGRLAPELELRMSNHEIRHHISECHRMLRHFEQELANEDRKLEAQLSSAGIQVC